ncbi:hypothetical protein TWF694_005388 [Orbilia ellipsospora]|uniref:F-box domain-containing protein n=1 Tax=Orbilia ellipsospora TaxID=2528407 RepID=A0AAV9WUA1_9PEZI
MATFQDLPVEIKLLILKNLTDLDSLYALRRASEAYKHVYDNYKESLDSHIWTNELQPYKTEAYFFAAYKEKLGLGNRDLMLEEVIELVTNYLSACKNDGEITPESFLGTDGITAKVAEDLIKTHTAVRELCDFFAYGMLSVKQPEGEIGNYIPATYSENQRITKALYRVWLIYLIFLEREANFEKYTVPFSHADDIFNEWGGWEFMMVKIVRDFCWRKLEPIVQRFREFVNLGFPYHQLQVDRTEVSQLMFGAVMASDFPHGCFAWFTFPVDESTDGAIKMQNLLQSIGSDTIPSVTSSISFTRFLNDPPLSGVGLWNKIYPMRICKPGHRHFGPHEEYGEASWIRPFKWRNKDEIDLNACIWDEWRLESWEYVYPVFEEGGDSRPEGCDDPYVAIWPDPSEEELYSS